LLVPFNGKARTDLGLQCLKIDIVFAWSGEPHTIFARAYSPSLPTEIAQNRQDNSQKLLVVSAGGCFGK
jgi:hypothetical protein